ncbi:MAG: Lipolytic protein G-D-S-L family [Limisphaerales bacterium]|nr:MAG: Lipolytic protein G-D-S-L family [Limisphaerales bacterium]KAG0510550.1 MAG: Lipolytic protein G-D-S-L family [Limisphaerales bacterium]TXT52823.1 MAG: Lipolytic protein G-D-S-L family [Limisphaerales bacterium]
MQTRKRSSPLCPSLAAFAVTALLSGALLPAQAEILVKDGQKVAFMGDSITAGGWGNPGGYVRLIVAGLEANGVKVTPVPAGISGHKSDQMLARLKKDALDKKPDWMTLSCGVNDVWHGARGIPLDQYKQNITAILDQCATAGTKVVVLTATVISEELDAENNKKLAPYNEFLRNLARERKAPLADLYGMFESAIKAHPNTTGKPGRQLTSDGVHMAPPGDQLMARGVLQAFGLGAAQLKKAEAAWQEIPGAGSVRVRFDAGQGKSFQATAKLSLRQREQLAARATKEGKSLDAVLSAAYAEEVKALIKPGGEFEAAAAVFEAKKNNDVQARLQAKFDQRVEALLKH